MNEPSPQIAQNRERVVHFTNYKFEVTDSAECGPEQVSRTHLSRSACYLMNNAQH